MREYNTYSTSELAFPPQPQRPEEEVKPAVLEQSKSDTTKRKHVFITRICATDVACGLRRLPAGFRVVLDIDGKITKTSNKPVMIGQDVVEWDERILLPSDRSSVISFKVYASFELGPSLGNGELLREFKILVGEVFDLNERLESVKFLASIDDVSPSCSTVRIITKQCNCDANECRAWHALPEPDEMDPLERLTDEGHHSLLRYRLFQDQADLDHAILCFEQVQDRCPLDHLNHSAVLFNLANAKFIYCQTNNHDVGLDESIVLYRDALHLRPSGHLDHVATTLELSFALLVRFQRQCNETDRTEAMGLLSRMVELSPIDSGACRAGRFALEMAEVSAAMEFVNRETSPGDHANLEDPIRLAWATLHNLSHSDPLHFALVAGLGSLLYFRLEANGDLADLHGAISMLERAMPLGLDGPIPKWTYLFLLGGALSTRFERLGNLDDIERSIPMLEEAVCLTPDCHPEKLDLLNTLGISLSRRFERLGDMADTEKSISIFEEVVHFTPGDHPDKSGRLNNLGVVLLRRFESLGNLADLNRSMLIVEDAVRLIPDHHPDKPSRLNNLGNSLFRRFERLGDLVDLNKSISIFEEVVHLTPDHHPERLNWLSNLGNPLFRRFERLGNLADIDKSISAREEAVRLTPDYHPNKPILLNGLGTSLSCRFEWCGELVDMEKSISIFEEAIRLTLDGHPEKPNQLHGLGLSLVQRFYRLGDLEDIDKSISMFEEAVRLTPDLHPGKASRLNSLGISLFNRFHRLGYLVDIERSISVLERAICLTPDHYLDKQRLLKNLGQSLSCRFKRLGDPVDIEKCISMFKEAVRLTPDYHPDKSNGLRRLGSSLSQRFDRLDDLEDINKSILMFEEAVYLIPDGHPERPNLLNSFGISLSRRFLRLGDPGDIEKSISLVEEAVRRTPDRHPAKPGLLVSLGNSFKLFFDWHSRDLSHLSVATSHFSVASQSPTGPISDRFRAARYWITSARVNGNSQTLLDAYSTAISLLPQLAWLGLPLTERHRVLVDAVDVARDAAAAALEAGHAETAVMWLEQGRSVVWSQFLQLRTPVDQLRVRHPVLADTFEQISKELECASSHDNLASYRLENSLPLNISSFEQEGQRHRQLAFQREKLLGEIHSLPDFEQFLLPKSIKQLAALANSGPVVYLNASKHRCDALIVMAGSGSVIPVPLQISYQDTENLYGVLRLLLERNRLIITRDDISSLIPSDDSHISRQFVSSLLAGDDGRAVDRAAKVKPQRIVGYTPDDLFRRILACLWNDVVNPVLQALGFLSPASDKKKMTRIFWCPTGLFTFLPIHAAGLYDAAGAGLKLSDFVISSYLPTLGALTASEVEKGSSSHCRSDIRLVAIPQPQDDGQMVLTSVDEEINHIKTLSAKSQFIIPEDSDGTVEDVMAKMANADWVHFACHGIQDPENPLDSGLCLANHRRLKLSDIIQLSRPRGGLAFLSACLTARGDEELSEESVHLAAGMLLAGYGGVIATMWSIMDNDAPKVAKDVYEYLLRDDKVPDSAEAAEALHYAVQRLRDSGASFSSWVPFIHVGR